MRPLKPFRSNGLDIKSWAEEDRPREKLLIKGKSVLSDAELLAIIIGSGTPDLSAVDLGKSILRAFDNSLDLLAKISVSDLKKFKGIGEAKAVAIVSALEIGRRRNFDGPVEERRKILCSQDAFEVIKPHLLDLRHEEFWVIFLNRANRVISSQQVSSGGVTGTIADPKIIFRAALEASACSIVLVHNHPSGNAKPSESDNLLTKRIQQAGKFIEVPVLDHIIFTDTGYFSYADESML